MEHDRDPRLDPLASRMRENGQPPERDLWPGIEEAIDRREQTGRRRSRAGRWRLVAAAAALAVIVLGVRDLRAPRENGPLPMSAKGTTLAVAEGADDTGRMAIDRALAELNEAMSLDPDNPNLSKLVLMVHRTRGEMLRRGADSPLRTS